MFSIDLVSSSSSFILASQLVSYLLSLLIQCFASFVPLDWALLSQPTEMRWNGRDAIRGSWYDTNRSWGIHTHSRQTGWTDNFFRWSVILPWKQKQFDSSVLDALMENSPEKFLKVCSSSKSTSIYPLKLNGICESLVVNLKLAGDILVISGDFTTCGLPKEVKAFNTWLGTVLPLTEHQLNIHL